MGSPEAKKPTGDAWVCRCFLNKMPTLKLQLKRPGSIMVQPSSRCKFCVEAILPKHCRRRSCLTPRGHPEALHVATVLWKGIEPTLKDRGSWRTTILLGCFNAAALRKGV